jgi:hypothetical protein
VPPPPPILLDSILLLLLTLGSFEPSTLRSFKRLSQFVDDDLALLRAFLLGRTIVVTPYTLTELCNLANALPSGTRIAFAEYLRRFLPVTEERQLSSLDLTKAQAFIYFGITDAALYALSNETVLLTEDGRLRDFLHRHQREAFSLSDLRRIRDLDLNKE